LAIGAGVSKLYLSVRNGDEAALPVIDEELKSVLVSGGGELSSAQERLPWGITRICADRAREK